MERVQAALSEQLQSRNTQLEIELREKVMLVKFLLQQYFHNNTDTKS